MKRFIDDPRTLVSQMIDGYLRAFGRSYEKVDRYNGIVRRCREERVSIVTGGGSGGEPWCIGMAGDGLADGVAVGNIFSSPPATAVAAVARTVYNREGVLLIAGNHSGDVMNFELAKELLELDPGVRCETLFVTDNLASSSIRSERSGLTGGVRGDYGRRGGSTGRASAGCGQIGCGQGECKPIDALGHVGAGRQPGDRAFHGRDSAG